MEVNGKHYPLWSQFVERKEEWIGGTLEDHDVGAVGPAMSTKITDIELRPNGEDSAYFKVEGQDFGCGFDVRHGGISGGEEGWITFYGYAGHMWRIKRP